LVTSPLKPKLVILGAGFGGFSLLKKLDRKLYDITVVGPRNHFLFTPLLPSSTMGTVEFRSIIEPIRRVFPDVNYYQASSRELDRERKTVRCVTTVDQETFDVSYDFLVIAVGAKVNTFGIPGVADHALFLKTVEDARRIRARTLECFERASEPGLSEERRRQLLRFVVVGGGPTGVEFAAELHDFVKKEIKACYASVMEDVRITIVDAAENLLSTFDKSLSLYTTGHFKRQDIEVKTGLRVTRVEKERIALNDGSEIPYGLLLWSTGIGPTIAANNFDLPKDKASRFLVSESLRVKGEENVYAMGDCSLVEGKNFPATAQVAMQQGAYLGKELTRLAKGKSQRPFQYHHYGMLAYVGDNSAVADLAAIKGMGRAAFIFWRSVYLNRLVSVKNKMLVLFDWFKATLFGRDISRF
jgi:NADH:ubiquinone reductase (non-electrogenic)